MNKMPHEGWSSSSLVISPPGLRWKNARQPRMNSAYLLSPSSATCQGVVRQNSSRKTIAHDQTSSARGSYSPVKEISQPPTNISTHNSNKMPHTISRQDLRGNIWAAAADPRGTSTDFAQLHDIVGPSISESRMWPHEHKSRSEIRNF